MAEQNKKSLWQEFQEFISRGNVIDLAVGIIIGSAFTGIVNSLVKEIIMPPIGLIIGRVNFSDLKLVLQPASGNTPEVAVAYGDFLQNVFNFLIVALVVFSLVKAINTLQRIRKKKEQAEEKAEEKKQAEDELSVLKDIRSALQKQKAR